MEVSALGKYELRGTRGRGAMGTVYEAWDPIISRRVAIKTVRLPDPSDPEAQEQLARFRREAQAAGRLNHPSIVGVYDYVETDELAYIVMEYVDGESLKSVLDRGERLELADIRAIMEQLLSGLQFSHERGVVHRDVKPGNVMLTTPTNGSHPASATRLVKITDFGIARIESSNMTQTGTMLGTPAYMSPEQFMGHDTTAKTDIYSAGTLLFQLLTGTRPFDGAMSAIMHKVLSAPPPRPSAMGAHLAAFDAVAAKAMARLPEQRYDSVDAFLVALRAAFNAATGPAGMEPDPDATVIVGAAARPAAMAIPMVSMPRPAPAASSGANPLPSDQAATTGGLLPLLVAGTAMAVVVIGGLAWFLLRPVSFDPVIETPMAPVAAVSAAPVAPIAVAPVTIAPVTIAPVTVAPVDTPPPPLVIAALPAADPPPRPLAQPPSLAALRAAVSPVECTLVNPQIGGPQLGGATSVFVTGLSQRGPAESALRRSVTDIAPDVRLGWSVTGFDGPFCQALDVLRPMRLNDTRASAALAMSLKGDLTRLRQDDTIVLRIIMPEFAGHLQVDYLSSDGSIAHLVTDDGVSVRVMTPSGWVVTGPSRRYAAGQVVIVGEPDPAGTTRYGAWAVDEPFGTDMIVAIVSEAPLFREPRPASDAGSAYFRALRTALAAAQARGTRLSGQALLLETVARAP